VDAVKDGYGAREGVAYLGGILDVHFHTFHQRMLGAAAGTGEDPDVFPLARELFSDRPTHGAGSGNNIDIGHDFSSGSSTREHRSLNSVHLHSRTVKSGALNC
jgi:hypothetical protein